MPRSIESRLLSLLIAVGGLVTAAVWVQAQQQTPRSEPAVVWMTSIRDPELIKRILDDQLYVTDEDVTRIEIYDLTRNGFGENDVAVIYPQQTAFPLARIAADLAADMSQWEMVLNREIAAEVGQIDADDLEARGNPVYAILGAALGAIHRNYHDSRMRMTLEVDSLSVHFRLWGYNPDSLLYAPPEIHRGLGDAFDVFHVFRADTSVVADSTLFDLVYVYRTYEDTVYVPTGPAADR